MPARTPFSNSLGKLTRRSRHHDERPGDRPLFFILVALGSGQPSVTDLLPGDDIVETRTKHLAGGLGLSEEHTLSDSISPGAGRACRNAGGLHRLVEQDAERRSRAPDGVRVKSRAVRRPS